MDDIKSQITAVILAGGRNIRFGGSDKAFALIAGAPMVSYTICNLLKVFKNILVITDTPERYSIFNNVAFASDLLKDFGPLGGIHAAMRHVKTPYIFVVSCDMPYIDTGIIRDQIYQLAGLKYIDALIPRLNSNLEPLHAIYSTRLAETLEKFLSASHDYSIKTFLEELNVRYYDLYVDDSVRKAFSNINIPRELPGAG